MYAMQGNSQIRLLSPLPHRLLLLSPSLEELKASTARELTGKGHGRLV